jgi:hypothetical protein
MADPATVEISTLCYLSVPNRSPRDPGFDYTDKVPVLPDWFDLASSTNFVYAALLCLFGGLCLIS